MPVNEEDCPCFYGGSCPSDYKHKDTSDHWQVIAKMFDCPECGWVTAHYSHCAIVNPSDQLTCHDMNMVRYALEVYLAHQDWDKGHEDTIKRVLSKVTKLQDSNPCPA